ncbi:phosphatidylinositol 4-phosphate 5-kinase-like protein 1 isoform X2 [Meriones unguiculatus]|uniref:phosphatidylinositol 4-phosphate 5-kinase-like protein 1 isoform X2 n=1 Tax=Meriones unguiculatus TaxID=10047 RepID=UPI00293E8A8D|nr:phosphatidylinositol 4-phosphate 5-kinase-like protein 1 isoform X2 [Meriones unguiculatus]
MPEKTGETQFRLPSSTPSNSRPRLRKKGRLEASLRQPSQGSAAPPSQSSEDALDSEVVPAGRRQRPTGRAKATATESFLQQPTPLVGPATPPNQEDQGPEDAASSEARFPAKNQRPKRGWGAYRATSLGVCRNEEAGPDSCIGTSGTPPKPEKLQLGAMAATPSLGRRETLSFSPEIASMTVSSGNRGGFFWRLRDKQKRVGLFEISPGHELHRITRMMQEGLWAATQVSMDNPPTVNGPFCLMHLNLQEGDPAGPPTQKDYSEVMTQVHEEGFELGTLAGPAFARLRQSLGLTESDYQATLGPGGPYLQFLSTSKSKAIFFLTHDQRFFLKTQRRQEVQVLLAHLPRYMQHLKQYPHSLLARLLGVHSLRVAREKKKYFIIMNNVFYPAGRNSERYDIKGCKLSRWVEPAPEGSPILLVLKDLNFQGKTMKLGPQRKWLLHQIDLDIAFLRDLNILDYSLLVAFQLLHEDEKEHYRGVIFRTFRSVHGALDSAEAMGQNRRLLSDVPNALHILDGPDLRYFLGLVDLTTVYGLRKRLEQLWKTVRYRGQSFSTVSPAHYARRLYQWVEQHSE